LPKYVTKINCLRSTQNFNSFVFMATMQRPLHGSTHKNSHNLKPHNSLNSKSQDSDFKKTIVAEKQEKWSAKRGGKLSFPKTPTQDLRYHLGRSRKRRYCDLNDHSFCLQTMERQESSFLAFSFAALPQLHLNASKNSS